MGTFVVLRGMAFFGDALAHAILPGVAVAYLAGGARSPLPLLPLSGLFYAFTFGLPAFSGELDP